MLILGFIALSILFYAGQLIMRPALILEYAAVPDNWNMKPIVRFKFS